MISWFGKAKESFCLAIDIGTASISAVLFSCKKDGKPDIIKIFRKYHKHSLSREGTAFQKSALRDLMLLFKEVERLYPRIVVNEIRIGLASPFYLARTLTLSAKHDAKEKITENDINRIIQKGSKEIEQDFLENTLKVFETHISRLTLNGYELARIVGRQAEDIALTIRYAAVKKEFLKTLSERLASATKAANIRFFTFPVIYFSVFHDLISQKKEPLLFLDIGGETTEITLVENATIREVSTLPIGVLNFIYRIAEKFNTDNDSASALLKRYSGGTLEGEAAETIKTILKNEIQKWRPAFARMFEAIESKLSTTLTVFILGGGTWIDDFKEMLASVHAAENQENSPKILNTTPAAFRERLGHYGALAGPEDFGLLALILAPKHGL